jgi:asparagine synthase (glutamine-hydrolysing)
MPRARGVLDDLGVLRGDIPGWRDGIAAAETRSAGGGRTPLQVAQALDCADWLLNDLLLKLDRCLMAHGPEGRTSFLDTKVAEFALRNGCCAGGLPSGCRRRGRLPASTGLRCRWRNGSRAAPRRSVRLSRAPAVRELCRPDAVETLFAAAAQKRAGRAAWTLLFYALWHRRHMERTGSPPDTLAALAEEAV